MKLSEINLLARLAVLSALGKHDELRLLAKSKAFQSLPDIKVVETILEVHLFAGIPAAIEAFSVIRSVRQLTLGNPSGSMPIRERRTSGERVCRSVYASKYEALMRSLRQLNTELAIWILEDGYGKVLSRAGLSLVERELIAVAVLAANGWRRQLHSHLLGSLHVGATSRELKSVCRVINPLLTRRNAHSFQIQIRSIRILKKP